jgi:hypothetical protein
MEFGYDGKHGAYQPQVVRGPAVPPPPPIVAIDVGPSAAAPASPLACAPSSTAPKLSRATTVVERSKIFSSKGSRLWFPCVAPTMLSSASHTSR